MSLPLLYRQTAGDDSLMARNDLLFRPSTQTEVEAPETWGVAGMPAVNTSFHNDTIIITLLLAIVCAMTYWRTRKHAVVVVLFCILGALLTLITSRYYHLSSPVTPDWLLLVIYAILMGAYLGVKKSLYHGVNRVFFSTAQQGLWRRHYTYLLMVETMAFLPIVFLSVFTPLGVLFTFQMLVVVLLFVKIWLLWRCYSVFFRKKHGLLHLFVYFCTLESTPFVVLCASVIIITRSLTFIQ